MFARFRHSHTDQGNIVARERKTRNVTNFKLSKRKLKKSMVSFEGFKKFSLKLSAVFLQINKFVATETTAVSLFMPIQNTSHKNTALKFE